MKTSWGWNRIRLCYLTGKKTLRPVTFYPIQLSAFSTEQKDFLTSLKLQVANTIFWNILFSKDRGDWTYLLVYVIHFLAYCSLLVFTVISQIQRCPQVQLNARTD